MVDTVYRANLTASEFPLLSEFQGRNVIVPGPDQNFSRQLTSPRNKDKDIGIPQAYYGHNIIPVDAGFSSVGYQTVAYPPSTGELTFDAIFLMRDPSENVAYLGLTQNGNCYVLLAANGTWLQTTSLAPVVGEVTTAHVNGQTYVYFGGLGCYKYTFATNTMTPVTLTSLNPALILGISAAAGFMLAYTSSAVFTSSTIDPTDFTPSLITSAGSQAVQDALGPITTILPHAVGVIVYTKKNAVIGYYTGQAQFPFKFKGIQGSGGVASSELVSQEPSGTDASSSNHLVYSTNGLEAVSPAATAVRYPQVIDFLAGSQFEDFNESTLTFTLTDLASPMLKKLIVVANRYLVISYGINSLTHALVYDASLDRWGKFKINHTDCFEYSLLSSAVVEVPRRSIAFLQTDGTVQVVTMSYNVTGSYGVLILGKYQYYRAQYLQLTNIELETIKATASVSVNVLSSVDGKNTTPAPTTLRKAAGTYRSYGCRTTGVNHSIVIVGAFLMNSLILTFQNMGNVR